MANTNREACPWERHWDESSGSYYYFNPTTEASEWDVPEGWQSHFASIDAEEAAVGTSAGASDPIKNGEEQKDRKDSAHELSNAGVPLAGGEKTGIAKEPYEGQANGDSDYSIQEAAAYTNGESSPAVEGTRATEFHTKEGNKARVMVSPEDHPTSAPRSDTVDDAAGDQDKRDIVGGTSMEDPAVAEDSAPTCTWIKTADDSGAVYYFNQITEESVWEEPAQYTEFYSTSRKGEEGAREDTAATAQQEDSLEDMGTENRMEEDAEEGSSPHPPKVVTPTLQEHRRQQERGTAVLSRFSSSHVQRDSPSPEFYNGGVIGTVGGVTSPSSGEDFSPGHDWQGSPSTSPPGSFSMGASPSPPLGVVGGAGYAVGELSPVLDDGDGDLVDALGGENRRDKGAGMLISTGKENKETSEEELQERIKREERVVNDLERRLEERDAIMEIDFHVRVTEYLDALSHLKELKGEKYNNKESLKQSMKKLMSGYHGYAQQTSLVNSWLRMVSEGGRNDSEEMMVRELRDLLMDNFDSKKADGILDSGRMPPWINTMYSDDGWRRTLIELAKEHKGSALLRYILKQLSDKGHHREIAAVISETDLFAVFNGVLKDALARIPVDDEERIMDAMEDLKRMCCSTSFMFMYSQQLLIDLEAAAKEGSMMGGESKSEKSTDADEGGSRRSGSRKRGRGEQGSGQRQKQKRQEQQQAATKSRTNGTGPDKAVVKSKLLSNAATARKYKRLRQELVKHMCEIGEGKGSPVSKLSGYASSAKALGRPSVAFVREVERALSEGTHAVLDPSGKGIPADLADAIKANRVASDAVVLLLEQVNSGAAAAVAAAAVAAAAGASASVKSTVAGPHRGVPPVGVGNVGTIQRTAVLSEAVDTLVSSYGLEPAKSAAVLQGVAEQAPVIDVVRPSASLVRHDSVMNILLEALFHPMLRSPSDDVKKGCCAILAYASCVEVQPRSTSRGIADKRKDKVDPVELAETSQALMRAAHVCFDKRASKAGSLFGRLRSLAEHPIVSLGVMRWIHAQVSMDSFCSTPNFLSSSPVFLKLCELTADEHPPQRPEVFEILKLMLSARVAPDTPMTARTNLKKQVLLRMVHITARGYVIPVLVFIRKMAAGLSLDQNLAAFFVAKFISVTQPKADTRKYSSAFLNALVAVMVIPRVKQAIQSSSLSAVDRERVQSFVRFCTKFQAGDFKAEGLEAIKQFVKADTESGTPAPENRDGPA